MRLTAFALFLILGTGPALSQPASSPADPPRPLIDRLQQADLGSALEDMRLKPWRLRFGFQLYTDQGKPLEQGHIEEVWLSPQLYQISFASPSYTSTTIRNADGFYRTKGTPPPPDMLETLRLQVVHPMPPPLEILNSSPEQKVQKVGATSLDCIMLDQPIKNLHDAPIGLFPTYCMDVGKTTLRMSVTYASMVSIRNTMGLFQGRSVSLEPVLMINNVQAASAHVESLSGIDGSTTLPVDLATMETRRGTPASVPGKTVAGMALRQPPPIYPDSAKRAHISGTVILHARIGTDGHVHTLVPLSAPDPSLAISAIVAVSQWRYKPYYINDEPVEVETTINVNYTFGPASP